MGDELFNPAGNEGDPIASLDDAIEGAACVGLARWLTLDRPEVVAVELRGGDDELTAVSALTTELTGARFDRVTPSDDPALWDRAVESWHLLRSIGRATRRVVAADESRHWWRGDI